MGSASVQSHLSHPRHRDSRQALEPPVKDCSHCSVRKDHLLLISDGPLPRPRVWPNSFRWMLSCYIIVSSAFFSAALYRSYSVSLFTTLHPETSWQTHSSPLSDMNILPPAARLAKLISLHPPPIHFGPFAYRSVVDPHPHEVTACLWAPETNLDWVPSWTNDWLGPISLLVVTRMPPASTHAPPHHPKLGRLLHHPMLNASRLALHILHLDPATPDAPNVFLNLARLFAPTRTVLLVPGTPRPPPPVSILSLSVAHVRDPVVVQPAIPGPGTRVAADNRRPTLLAALSPMLIPRDHPLWCMERFAFVPAPVAPRAVDWDACLWQVQLETFGAATTNALSGWRWDVEPEPHDTVLQSASRTSAIRRRLDTRYRAETCMLAIRRFEVLSEECRGGSHGRVGARLKRKCAEKMRWLHEMCRE